MPFFDLHFKFLVEPSKEIALIIDDKEVTFSQLVAQADLYARTLAGLGVEPGDRVSFFMGNRPELAALYLACFKLGAVGVPTSCYNKPVEAAYELNHCQAKLFLVEPELYDGVADMTEKVPCLQGVYMVGGEPDDPKASWSAAAKEAPDTIPQRKIESHDPAVILYTSGSTGKPKGVTHTFFSLYHSTVNRLVALKHVPKDVYFISSYLCHGSALTSVFLPMLAVGGKTVLMRHFTPEAFLECLRRRRPTVGAAAPSQVQEVLELPSCGRDDFASLRYLHVGGDAAPLPLFQKFLEKTGLELSVAMGMTECGGYLLTPPKGPHKPGSLGRPISGTEIRIVDQESREVPSGEIGQMIVKTKAMMRGYWNDTKNTADTIKDGWIHTGDLVRKDEDGFFYFVGRSKHIIIRDTGNVAPAEVEETMEAHPMVRACGVVGVADGKHGQAVMALIVPQNEGDRPSVEEMTAFAKERLAERKVPLRWAFVDEIPLTPMAKIDRKALDAMANNILTEQG